MRLRAEKKEALLEAATQVYLAYTALDFFKEKKFFPGPAGAISLHELCIKALKENRLDQNLVIDGVNYHLLLTPGENSTYTVTFVHPIRPANKPVVKTISEYTKAEALNLLTTQQFSLDLSDAEKPPVVSNKINERYSIGGKNKIDLYRTHLVTLHHIIEKITKEEDISNLLVALATGSGKTFVQALWMFVLHLSDNNGIFAVPDHLTHQFGRDLRRLLPDAFVNSVKIMREEEEDPEIPELMQALRDPDADKAIIIASSHKLLDQHYQDLLEADSETTFLAFDEQHLIMNEERQRVRLLKLTEEKLAMFLTATPNEETYALSGNKPVAIMSSGQKEEAGQGQFPKLITHHAQKVSDKNTFKNYKFWTLEFWQVILDGWLLRFTNAIEEEHSSAAVSLVEALPFYYHELEQEENPRWRFQVPSAQKVILAVIDDNESLVNFIYALMESPSDRRDVYHNGNLVDRSEIARFFGIPDGESNIVENYMQNKRAQHQEALAKTKLPEHARFGNLSLREQLQSNMFHSLVEYVLTDITGLDTIEQDRLRKHNSNAFKELVISKYELKNEDHYFEKLIQKIDLKGASELSSILADLSAILGMMNAEEKASFIDNWYLNTDLMGSCTKYNFDFKYRFENYARDHIVMGIMTGMNKAETPIAESKPFLGLRHKVSNLYDGGRINPRAKKRKHTSLEILDDTSREHTFIPNYANITKEQADAYASLGLIGIYVSNNKSEGWSEKDLQTVINITEHTLSKNNSPNKEIQILGRNRGLNDTIKPTYIRSQGRKQKAAFDLKHLRSDNYYPELFKAQKKYNKDYIQALGDQVSQQLMSYIYANLDADDTINPDRLKRKTLQFIVQALREINNKNSHHIKLSRAQLADIVAYAMKGVDKEIERINKPYKLGFFVRVLGTFLNLVRACYYSIFRLPVAWSIFMHSWFGKRELVAGDPGQKHPDDVYIKILNKTSFKKIAATLPSIFEFKNWLQRKNEGLKVHVKKNWGDYLKDDLLEEYKVLHEEVLIVPVLMKLVVPGQRDKLAKAIAAFPQFTSYLAANLPLLAAILQNKSPNFAKETLYLLQQIPGLELLQASDLVNYPQEVADLENLFKKNPVEIVNSDPELKDAFTSLFAKFLKYDFCAEAPAFMTYHQATRLKTALNKDNKAQEFVVHCMKQSKDNKSDLSPQGLIKELNVFFPDLQLTTLDESLSQLSNKFKKLQTKIEKNPRKHIAYAAYPKIGFSMGAAFFKSLVGMQEEEAPDPATQMGYLCEKTKNKLVHLGNEKLLPILASFIKDHAKKEHFLKRHHDTKAIFQFITNNLNEFQRLEQLQADEEGLKNCALGLINQLMPKESPLTLEELVHPQNHALEIAKEMTEDLKVASFKSLINSELFHKLMETMLNQQDFELLLPYITQEESIAKLAEDLAFSSNPLNRESLINCIRNLDPKLKDITSLDVRLNDFHAFFGGLEAQNEQVLDKDKMAPCVADLATPVLFNDDFIKTVDKLIGFLDERDLTVIFEAFQKNHCLDEDLDPAEEAAQFILFLKLIRQKNRDEFIAQFLKSPDPDADFNSESLPLKRMIELMHKLMEEVLDTHCYYHQCGRSGNEASIDSHLSKLISENLKRLTIKNSGSFMDRFARKIAYIEGIRNGLGKAGEINAQSNHHKVKILQRIKTHVLRPLWWSSNISERTHNFIKACRNGVYRLHSCYFSVVNAGKSALNFISRSHYFTISSVNQDSQDYNNTTHDFAKEMNELTPLTPEQVTQECPADVLVKLEQFIESRPSRTGFFGNLGLAVPAKEPGEEAEEPVFAP